MTVLSCISKDIHNRKLLVAFTCSMAVMSTIQSTPDAIAQTAITATEIETSRSLTLLGPSETVLCEYREKDYGMFSHMWAAYILSEGEDDNRNRFDGITRNIYRDRSGQIVGKRRLGGITADTMAVADATATGSNAPEQAKYLGSRLAYTKRKGEQLFVLVDGKESGPFLHAGRFVTSPSGEHYAYSAENQNGKWVVVDGKYQTPYFEGIYKVQFVDESEIAFLTVKNGRIVRVACKVQ